MHGELVRCYGVCKGSHSLNAVATLLALGCLCCYDDLGYGLHLSMLCFAGVTSSAADFTSLECAKLLNVVPNVMAAPFYVNWVGPNQ
jgi:hypothetical protein